MSNITNLPSTTVTKIRQAKNLAEALERAFLIARPHSFLKNSVANSYKSATEGAEIKVVVNPNYLEGTSLTSYDTTELTQSDYAEAAYGAIPVKLDYIANQRFKIKTADLSFTDRDMIGDALKSNVKQIVRQILRKMNERLRTSAFAVNYGTSGTALNAKVFQSIRNAADLQGYQDKRIEIRLSPAYYNEAVNIPEFQKISGYVGVSGNNDASNTSISSTMFRVEGQYNIDFIKDDLFDIPVPGTDPVGVAYTDVSATPAFRGLEEGDEADVKIFEPTTGITLLLQPDEFKVAAGRVKGWSLEGLYGFSELSGDIDQVGDVQSAPIFNVLGGEA